MIVEVDNKSDEFRLILYFSLAKSLLLKKSGSIASKKIKEYATAPTRVKGISK